MNSELVLGYKLYSISFAFTTLAMFFQVVPLNAAAHFFVLTGLSTRDVVNLASLFFITYAVLQIPGGVMLDNYGIKYIIPIYISITTIGFALYWYSSAPLLIGLSRLITGAGCSLAYISGIYISIKYLPVKWLMLFIGAMESASTLGAILALKPFKSMLDTFGWESTGYMIILFCALLIVLSLIVLQKVTYNANRKSNIWQAYQDSFGLLKNKVLLAMFIYSFATWLVIMSFAGCWLKDYLVHIHKYSEVKSLTFLQICWFSFMISNIIISFIVKKASALKVIIIILAGIGFATYATMSIPIVFNYAGTVIVLILNGISASGIIIAFTLIPKLSPSNLVGTAVAMNNVFIVMGGIAGQVLFGYVLKNIDIAQIITSYNFGDLETPYYTGLLIYPIFTLIAFFAILYVVYVNYNGPLKSDDSPFSSEEV